MLTELDRLKQAITDSVPDQFQWRIKRHDQPDLECFTLEVSRFKSLNVQFVHLVGHGSQQDFWWYP